MTCIKYSIICITEKRYILVCSTYDHFVCFLCVHVFLFLLINFSTLLSGNIPDVLYCIISLVNFEPTLPFSQDFEESFLDGSVIASFFAFAIKCKKIIRIKLLLQSCRMQSLLESWLLSMLILFFGSSTWPFWKQYAIWNDSLPICDYLSDSKRHIDDWALFDRYSIAHFYHGYLIATLWNILRPQTSLNIKIRWIYTIAFIVEILETRHIGYAEYKGDTVLNVVGDLMCPIFAFMLVENIGTQVCIMLHMIFAAILIKTQGFYWSFFFGQSAIDLDLFICRTFIK